MLDNVQTEYIHYKYLVAVIHRYVGIIDINEVEFLDAGSYTSLLP